MTKNLQLASSGDPTLAVPGGAGSGCELRREADNPLDSSQVARDLVIVRLCAIGSLAARDGTVMNVRGERWPWIMRLAGAVVIILNLAACGTPAEGTTVNIVGARGQYIWAVTGSRFFVSSDAGAHWSSTAVPSGVVGTKTDALVSPTGALWLLNTNQNIASFSYALGSGESWSTTRTTLTWPGPAPKGRGAGGAILGSNGPGVVSAVVSDNNGNLAPAVLILVSSDGKAFQEHAPPITS